jgi:hypothetical protein
MQTVGLFFGVHLLEINGCDLVDPTSTHDFWFLSLQRFYSIVSQYLFRLLCLPWWKFPTKETTLKRARVVHSPTELTNPLVAWCENMKRNNKLTNV